jgi:hypothetical protein
MLVKALKMRFTGDIPQKKEATPLYGVALYFYLTDQSFSLIRAAFPWRPFM